MKFWWFNYILENKKSKEGIISKIVLTLILLFLQLVAFPFSILIWIIVNFYETKVK